jgi:hypothetical protein
MLAVALPYSSYASDVNASNFNQTKEELWTNYQHDAQSLTDLKEEYELRALKLNDKTMRFSLEKRGVEPTDGYPLYIALHGGGNAPASLNDSQWEDMKSYYHASVNEGIYVATRGITNSWKLHSEDDSYPLYDKLIESVILFDHVNPNRIYILGFSAGGDGVYQITPRMADRFAAANMSAGHHNWIKFDNLHNTPFMIQVGENDGAYKRNTVAAENNLALNQLAVKYGSGYIHDTYIHYHGSHNSWRDNDASRRLQTVINDPIAWLNGQRATKQVNSNAIDWLNQYTRDPAPSKLVWDLSVDANHRTYQTGAAMLAVQGDAETKLGVPNTLFYWLDVSVAESYPEKGKIVAKIDRSSNSIYISKIENISKFRILLNPDLLDLTNEINVVVKGKLIQRVKVTESTATMKRTLFERSDKNRIYDAEIILSWNDTDKKWVVVV